MPIETEKCGNLQSEKVKPGKTKRNSKARRQILCVQVTEMKAYEF